MCDRYLILDLKTASMDGWYLEKALAEGVLAQLQEDFPEGRWVLLEQVSKVCYGIPDEFFWLHRVGDV